ncbi:rod shape-determining protein MreC, partial [Nitrospinae bacterium AH_259_B05_G02_I21]|nr:rod shape-determining protein MreC [Nitrospinae bacterium AH_259_B05_G02_I21]
MDDVDEGDLVVTAGDDSIYPAGIEIGRVVKVEQGAPVPDSPRMRLARNETALFHDVQLESLVEIRRVD